MYFFFFWPCCLCGMGDLSSLTRGRTPAPAVRVPSPNHWTTREFPHILKNKEKVKILIYPNICNPSISSREPTYPPASQVA